MKDTGAGSFLEMVSGQQSNKRSLDRRFILVWLDGTEEKGEPSHTSSLD